MELTEIIEALLFATQEPLSNREIARAIKDTVSGQEGEPYDSLKKVGEKTVADAVGELIKTYDESGRAFTLVERPTGWRLYARPKYAEWIRALMPAKKGSRLSPPALETLAIVAYRQPITKAQIESVRGVAVDGVLQTLLDRNLARIGGRADLPGRPLLYETSELFLEYFNIKDLDDLPNSAELRRTALPDPTPAEEEAPQEEQLSMANIEKKDGEDSDKSEPASESATESENDTGSEDTEESEPKAQTDAPVDPEVEVESDAKSEPEAEEEPDPEIAPDVDSESDPEPEPEPESEAEAESDSETENATEPEPEPEPESAS